MIATLRGLLTGTPIGNSAILAVVWCVILTAAGYVWARARYNRLPAAAH
jgi:ABC-2 type transport system permease protein